MPDSKVFYALCNEIHALKFMGQIRYTIGPALDKFIRQLSDGPEPRGFLVDLRDAESIDSTSLGLLARIAKWMAACNAPKATLVSDDQDINELLIAISFDEVFDLVDEFGQLISYGQELGLSDATGTETAKIVLDAHRELMALSDDNKARFQDVVSILENELEHPRHAVA